MYKVLLLEDDRVDAELIVDVLRATCTVTTTSQRDRFVQELGRAGDPWDVILVDWLLPTFGGREALNMVLSRCPGVPTIVVSGSMNNRQAAAAIAQGATDFIPKEFMPLLPTVVERAVKERRATAELLRMQRIESIGTLATGITHDMNNLLGHVALAIGWVQQTCSEEHRKVLRKADSTIVRATALAQHILTFARGEDVRQETLDMGALVDGVVSFLRETSPANVTITVRTALSLPPIRGNQTQVQQVLQNLLVNARDALAGKEGAIEVTVDKVSLEDFSVSTHPEPISGPFVRLSVQDNDGGMSELVLSHIFESFYTTKPKGSGIGLSTVKTIMASHRGHIDVSSHLGVGTTFTLLFPVWVPTQAVPSPPALPQGDGETILIVDDELSVLEVMHTILESSNYRVLAAGSGSEAMTIYRKRMRDIAVVVTDMMMANIGGVALTKLLRQANPLVKVVFVSGIDSDPGARIEAQADAFLLKPFKAEVLLETLRALCRGQQVARHPGDGNANSSS